ncbi:MAG: CHAT domain-containing protein [Fischerella sp. CENA71]|nr:CHAT domain-containing protein [Fischerella sp. CENA71]
MILAAIPHGLRLDREIREIEDAILRATRRDLFEIRIRTAVRPADIRRAIAEERPSIVHFCGHGLEDGSLLLEDDGGNNKPVSPSGLASVFKLHADYVNCVLLNACYSKKTVEAIVQHIDYVIGMNQGITDQAAIAFSQGFYDALGYEIQNIKNIYDRAFEEGIVAIHLENILETNTPIFKSKNNREQSRKWSIEESVTFFTSRFAKAFPGVRGLKLFESPTEAVKRLAKLLEEPLVFQNSPLIWWFRGVRNYHITNFKILKNDTVLLNDFEEFKINKIAAFRSMVNYRCFVYVETKAMKPIGLYTWSPEEIQYAQKNLGYSREEYGIYEGKYLITREEYDDRACMINDEFRNLEDSKTEFRSRYLTPYNFMGRETSLALYKLPSN